MFDKSDDSKSRVFLIAVIIGIIIISAGCSSISRDRGTPTKTSYSPNPNVPTSESTDIHHTATVAPRTVHTTDGIVITGTPIENNPTPIPTQTEISTEVATDTVTPTHPFRQFAIEFNDGLEANALVPLEMHAYGNKNDTWYAIINATAPSVNENLHDLEWHYLANSYASAVVAWKNRSARGEIPDRLVVLDLDKESYELDPMTYTVKTEWVTAWNDGNITISEFHDRWQNTTRKQTPSEQSLAREWDRDVPNSTYYNSDDD